MSGNSILIRLGLAVRVIAFGIPLDEIDKQLTIVSIVVKVQ